MSTVRDFIKTRDIPADVKQKALAEFDFIKAGDSEVIDFHENANSLIEAFSWYRASSGYDFWERIANAEPMTSRDFVILHRLCNDGGVLYRSKDGRILCNKCDAEFELKEKGGE